jgi:two-component system C4-dicarboxylate transport sensor histidine kinase DctB
MTNRLGEITSDLLIFSRRPLNRREKVDFEETIRQIVREYQPEADRKKIRLVLNAVNTRSMVTGKRARFEQLASNLLRNAVQAVETIKGERLIRIDLTHADAVLCFAVEDNGPGVDESIRTQLFEPFFTTKDVGEGVGLGLAICFAIVEEAGGSIRAGNGESGGARFEVRLPMMKQAHKSIRKKPVDA